MTSRNLLRALLMASCATSAAQSAFAKEQPDLNSDPSILVDTIIVTADRQREIAQDGIQIPDQIAVPADTTAIAARTAGGALVGNGTLSGQLSYRGLAGQRVLGRVNGQRFATGGPNAMDPPLHYAPSVLVEKIEVARGVAPVSQGPSLAGAVNVSLLETEFVDEPRFSAQGRFAAQYRTVDDSHALGGVTGIASDRWRLGVIGSREEGEDYAYPGGTVVGTSFERDLFGAHAGFRSGAGELFIEYRRSETDPTGNPPFALDIVYFDTDFLQGGFRGEVGDRLSVDLRLGHVAVRHLMDNQTTRQPAAPPMQARATFAQADTNTAELSLRFGTEASYFAVGGDAEFIDKFVRITNPTNVAFFIDAQPDVKSERAGAFAQWRGAISTAEFELGARLDHTSQAAGIPSLGSVVPMGPRGLAAAFASADRRNSDTTLDAVARAWMPLGEVTPRVTLARKERVPSLLERFGWLPTEASFGLADGNIYVGDLSLKPETAWIAEIGFDFESDLLIFRPTVFYRRIDDFIQGRPVDDTVGVIDTPVEMIAAMNGDPTPLRFSNVDAVLFGADLDFLVRPISRLELSGTASYVRGKRRDIDDDLYRIAPANLRLTVEWVGERVSLGAEILAAAGQDHVSNSNDEETSDGYAVFGLFGRFAISDGLAIEAGMENLFDAYYQPHLAGRNRVGASDVTIGERLPGPGQGGWIRLNARF